MCHHFQLCHCFSCALFLGARTFFNFLLSFPLTLFLGSLQRESQWGNQQGRLQNAQTSLPHLCILPYPLCSHRGNNLHTRAPSHTHPDLLHLLCTFPNHCHTLHMPSLLQQSIACLLALDLQLSASILTDFACGKLTGTFGNDSHVTVIDTTGPALKQSQLLQISVPLE